jgi:hypothetical protein
VANLEDISSPDAVITSDFGQLAADLAQLALDLCGGTISVHKIIDEDGNLGTPGDQIDGAGWTFDADAAPDSATPPSGDTDGGGLLNFDIDLGGDNMATVDIVETLKPNFTFISASCTDQDTNPAGTPGTNAVNNIAIGLLDIISCTFYNAPDCSVLDDDCNTGVFNPGTGLCETQPKPNSTPCTDTDGNACTIAGCTGAGTSDQNHNFAGSGTSCSDGYACTSFDGSEGGSDACDGAGTCLGTPIACDDANACTDDSCAPASGCVSTPNTAACDDGDPCTTNDTCSGGACAGGPLLDCDDGDLCNGTETCEPASGCVSGTPPTCDDGDVCNGTERCEPASGCSPEPDAPLGTPCDADGNSCTRDHCDGTGNCVFVESDPLACPSDHYKCYKTRNFGARFEQREVNLADELATVAASVRKPRRFCNPADKNGEGIDDPTAHLMCYKIKEPRLNRQDVAMEDQFGLQTLTVKRAETLRAPAEKDDVPSTLNVNHFKCYKVKRARGTGRFTERVVRIEDQFETKELLLTKPQLLCTPVDKNSEGIPTPAGYLTCYQIREALGQIDFQPRSVIITDQFAEVDLNAKRADCHAAALLCVPSIRHIASPSGAFLELQPGVLD